MTSPVVVYSDLDGTLLDANTHSFAKARPALEALAEAGIPLIFCTSKTRIETEWWRRVLGNAYPFVVENGGAAFVPEGYFGPDVSFDRQDGGYGILEFGRPYGELRQALLEIRALTGLPLRGFGDMTTEEIAALTGLSLGDAALAAIREYDEPLVGVEGGQLPLLVREARRRGLHVVNGGRFLHLVGSGDKGKAVRALRSLYESGGEPVTAIGLGDSANDEPLLRAVDIPVLVRRPDGSRLEPFGLPGLIIAPRSGPEGWRDAVFMLLRRVH